MKNFLLIHFIWVLLLTDEDIRLCVDLRAANQAIIRNFYAFPSIEDLIFSIPKPAKLSKVDLPSAFHLFELHPDSRDITTFSTTAGNFRFKRLVLGIKSAPEEFCAGKLYWKNG